MIRPWKLSNWSEKPWMYEPNPVSSRPNLAWSNRMTCPFTDQHLQYTTKLPACHPSQKRTSSPKRWSFTFNFYIHPPRGVVLVSMTHSSSTTEWLCQVINMIGSSWNYVVHTFNVILWLESQDLKSKQTWSKETNKHKYTSCFTCGSGSVWAWNEVEGPVRYQRLD